MKTRIYALMVLVLALTLLVAACSSGSSSNTTAPSSNTTVPSTTSSDGEKLFQEHCTACHSLSRATSQRLSAADWKTVVDSMVARGAKLTADEETLVVDYLAANYGK